MVDTKSFKKFFEYSLNTTVGTPNYTNANNFFDAFKENTLVSNKSSLNNLVNLTDVICTPDDTTTGYSTHFFKKFLLDFNTIANLNATTDGKNNSNPLLGYYEKGSRKKVISLKKPNHFSVYDDLVSGTQHNFYT
jgi:hypothetical protein